MANTALPFEVVHTRFQVVHTQRHQHGLAQCFQCCLIVLLMKFVEEFEQIHQNDECRPNIGITTDVVSTVSFIVLNGLKMQALAQCTFLV